MNPGKKRQTRKLHPPCPTAASYTPEIPARAFCSWRRRLSRQIPAQQPQQLVQIVCETNATTTKQTRSHSTAQDAALIAVPQARATSSGPTFKSVAHALYDVNGSPQLTLGQLSLPSLRVR